MIVQPFNSFSDEREESHLQPARFGRRRAHRLPCAAILDDRRAPERTLSPRLARDERYAVRRRSHKNLAAQLGTCIGNKHRGLRSGKRLYAGAPHKPRPLPVADRKRRNGDFACAGRCNPSRHFELRNRGIGRNERVVGDEVADADVESRAFSRQRMVYRGDRSQLAPRLRS